VTLIRYHDRAAPIPLGWRAAGPAPGHHAARFLILEAQAMHPPHVRDEIIRPTLTHLAGDDAPWVASEAAVQLVLGTALAESRLTFLVQHDGGPARGIYQMEPDTRRWLTLEYLPHRRPQIAGRIRALKTEGTPPDQEIVWNFAWATALCRARYMTTANPLPEAGNLDALGDYWVRHYNRGGAGTVAHFVDATRDVVA